MCLVFASEVSSEARKDLLLYNVTVHNTRTTSYPRACWYTVVCDYFTNRFDGDAAVRHLSSALTDRP